MNDKEKFCSFPGHLKNEAILFCQDCKQFRCNKCEKTFSEICKDHNKYKLNNNQKDIFIGFCLEKYHLGELKYFCKEHNQLCCAFCITKLKDDENGQHSNCEICFIKDIEEEKRNNLKENIKKLETMSNNLKEKINELKNIFEKMNEHKENLKLKIQKTFTNIRNEINIREDELLNEVDKKFDENYFKENIIRKSEKSPDKIKISLEKGKITDNEWNNNKLNSSINDCIIIENYLKDLDLIEKEIKKGNIKNNLKIKFSPEENEIKYFIEKIKNFGNVYLNEFIFKKCPININDNRKYEISGEKGNIITKTGAVNWMGTICEYPLDKNIEEHIWKIKVLNTFNYSIMIGIATSDFDVNRASYDTKNNFGWYYYCYNDNNLFSGPPHNYQGKKANLKCKKDEITIVMNMKKGSLKFIIDGEDHGDSYTNIPLDKELYPSVLLYHKEDSVEIMDIQN